MLGALRLSEFAGGAVASASEAEQLAGAYARCGDVEGVLMGAILVPAAPSVAQSSCVAKLRPLQDDWKALLSFRLQGKEPPALSEAARSRLAEGLGKCLSPDQRKLLGQ